MRQLLFRYNRLIVSPTTRYIIVYVIIALQAKGKDSSHI